MFKIMCLSGVLKGEEYVVENNQLTLGRSKDCEISIQDKQLSRKHCQIQNRNDVYFIVDLDSTNGVKHNEEWVSDEAQIANGDFITIGDSNFKCFSDEEDIYDAPTSAISKQGISSEKEEIPELILSETETTKVRKYSYETRNKKDGFVAFYDIEEED